MPFSWIMKPRNFPTDTTKAHLNGFIVKPYLRILSRVSFKLAK